MLSAEENKLLVETGPDTPMGNLLRRYWLPVLLSEELPNPDTPPIRVKLLSENLIAFRDSNNKVGLIDEYCPHRRASLFFGRNEEGGLRCVYHGWKFDACGKCTDMPSEPQESNFKDKVTTRSYPCKEIAGVVWAYMGPAKLMPELPRYEFLLVPKSHRAFSKRMQESNYFQGLEGVVDSSHISFLHREEKLQASEGTKTQNKYTAPKFEVMKADHGLTVAAKRNTDDPNKVYWRISQFLVPLFVERPPVNDPNGRLVHCWVPMDDENSMHWTFFWDPINPKKAGTERLYITELIPGTYRTAQNKDNDYLIDRELQASKRSYTGIHGVIMQDAAVQESAGAITDRSQERLGTSDTAIIITRRIMIGAALGLEKGQTPPGLEPSTHTARAASIMLPADVPFQVGAKQELLVKEGDYVPDPESTHSFDNRKRIQNTNKLDAD